MPDSIEDYLQLLLLAAAASPIVSAYNISVDKRTLRSGLIRGDLFFKDGKRLHFRELVDVQDDLVHLMYSYHYQEDDGRLIFRYDNTPHYPNLPGFPHHKHIESETRIVETTPPDLTKVLSEIERMYPLSSSGKEKD